MRADALLLSRPELVADPVARELCAIMTCPTGTTSAGFPYLRPAAWRRLRDWVPLLFGHGVAALDASARVRGAAVELGLGADVVAGVDRAASVIAQVIKTSAICAPADLWVLRHVVAQLQRAGLAAALVEGALRADEVADVDARELRIDLRFLLSRGVLVRAEGGGHRLAPHAHAAQIFDLPPPPLMSGASSGGVVVAVDVVGRGRRWRRHRRPDARAAAGLPRGAPRRPPRARPVEPHRSRGRHRRPAGARDLGAGGGGAEPGAVGDDDAAVGAGPRAQRRRPRRRRLADPAGRRRRRRRRHRHRRRQAGALQRARSLWHHRDLSRLP